MTPLAWSGFSIVVTCIGLAGFIFFKAPHYRVNNLMVMFNVFVGVWGLGTWLAGISHNPSDALWAWRLANAGGFPLGMTFYHLSVELTGDHRSPSIRFAYLVAAVGTLCSLTGWALNRAAWLFGSLHYAQANLLYVALVAIWSVIVVLGHQRLFVAYHRATGEHRRRLQFVFFAMATGFIEGTSALLPIFGVPLYPYGNFSIPIYSVLVTYAIVRHHLLDIRIVLQKSLVYSALIAIITAVYLVMVLIMERWFAGFFGYRSLVATAVVAGLIALGFNPLRDWLQARLDRALFTATTPELAAQREQLLEEVRKGDQMKAVATLAAGLAHEIKNPLASIKTFTESLDGHYSNPEFRKKFKRIVGGEVERINLIVQQLLEFAKPVPPKLMPLEVAQVVDDTLEFLGGEFVKRQVAVNRRYDAKVRILGDPQQLKQVFLNLVLNSLDAMNGHGKLDVQTAVEGSDLVASIADNGSGIAPKDLPHVFEPFYTTKSNGTGLGLAVVHGIVKEHGGRIQIQSQAGQGTTMRLYLPIAI